jgi:uncharacterized protein (TIGR03435 family)
MLLSLLALTSAFAQPPSFEVASVKPSTPPDYINTRSTMTGGPGSADPGRWTCDHYSLASLLRFAYNLPPFQVAGPPWMEEAYFAITAKVPAGATRDALRVMVQTLLAERFRMSARIQKQEIQGYELVVDKGGSKLRESPPLGEGEPEVPAPMTPRPRVVLGDDGYPSIPKGLAVIMTMGFRARRQAIRESMSDLARNLSAQLEKPVVDATGLKGKYDFTISWIRDDPHVPPMPPPGTDRSTLSPALDPSGPTLFRAVQEQLGLRLDSKKVQVDFLTVERAERTPIEN